MSCSSSIVIARTGTANLASVRAAFSRLGVETLVTSEPTQIAEAAALILPGVGSFGAAMQEMNSSGIADVVRQRVAGGRPLLAICLGLQLLAESSEESPGVSGLGVLPGPVTRFPEPLRVPHFGWNRVVPDESGGCIDPGHAYFANSYRMTTVPPGWRAAWTDYGGPFVAAVERDAVLACQFHPELSGLWGRAVIQRWMGRAGVRPC